MSDRQRERVMKGCKNRRERRERETREQRAGEGGQGERREKKTWEKRKSKRRSQRVENKCQGYKSLSRETRNLFFSSSSSLLSPHLSFKASLRVTMERAFARGERDAERGRRERERERERKVIFCCCDSRGAPKSIRGRRFFHFISF